MMTEAWNIGVGSLFIVLLISAFAGAVTALQAGYQFTGSIPYYVVGTLVVSAIILELGPVLTALILAGRIGARYAAELGTMRVTEQIDALETLCYDPFAFLCAPRVLAGAIMFPIVVAAAMLAGVGAGWVASIALLEVSSSEFVKGVRLFFDAFDVRYGLVKAASFGVAVTLIGCRTGLRARGGAQGVGAAATSAVVYSAIAILVLDAFWAVVWLLGHAR
jgi:phospholipid/cholesterol/gamma-HCH transport system permease protein